MRSALADPAMATVAAEAGVPWLLMHRRGTSRDMFAEATYGDVVADVRRELCGRVDAGPGGRCGRRAALLELSRSRAITRLASAAGRHSLDGYLTFRLGVRHGQTDDGRIAGLPTLGGRCGRCAAFASRMMRPTTTGYRPAREARASRLP
jgi:hypothetical protein